MLNYVWLALLILGIGAAVTTDIINKSDNKFKNGEPLPAVIHLNKSYRQNKEKSYRATIEINSEDFNSLYNTNIKKNLIFPAKISINKIENKKSIFFTVNNSFPEIWREMAGASGGKDDLTGNVKISGFINDSTASSQITLEKVSFLKLKDVTNSALDNASTAVTISLGLIGIMALWLGVMKVADKAGLIAIIANWLKPITKRLFPDVPSDHPAMGSMIMNISANMLGLGNAATPFGLKAMEDLDTLNPDKGTATNSMVTFLAINTAGMTLIPATAIAVRAAAGSSEPAIIIGTSLFGSFCATVAGITAAKTLEKFPIKKGEFGNWLGNNLKGFFIFLAIILLLVLIFFTGFGKFFGSVFSFLSPDLFKNIIQIFSTLAIPFLIIVFIGYGAIKKVKVYEEFVEGAKEGFNIAVKIIPYLVAMLMAIGIFRAGGAMDWLIYILKPVTNLIGMPAEALPMALMRPLSGSGSLGIMTEIISVHGPDSFIGILTSTFFGSTETTFYVLAVYFGAINIRNTRHAVPAGLIADTAGILGAVFIVRLLFG
ncbi:MAG: nucleoside recognition domain-containing protein [Ignavibacteriaceae bacterium]